MTKRILVIYRPVDDYLKGTGISAVSYWLKKKMKDADFEVYDSEIILNIPPFHSFLSIIFYDIINPILMAIKFKKYNIDHVFFVDVAPCFFIYIVKLILPCKKITTLIHAYPEESGIYLDYIRLLTKIALIFSDSIICTTEENKQRILEKYGNKFAKKIMVFPLGLTISDKGHYLDSNIGDDICFGYLGTSDKRKRLDRIVNILNYSTISGMSFNLLTAGPISKDFQEEINKNLTKGVAYKHFGVISEQEKVVFFEKFNVFLFPTQREGFGLPIIESFYYKKPCIVFETASIPRILKERCFLLKDDLSNYEEIINLIKNNKSKEIIESNYAFSLTFDWSQYVNYFLKY